MIRLIRTVAIHLRRITDKWVVPAEVYRWIDSDNPFDHEKAANFLRVRETLWPDDPEITRAKALLHFSRRFM